MICENILGNALAQNLAPSDRIWLEWEEAYKRIGRYVSENGKEYIIRLKQSPLISCFGLQEGDIIYRDEKNLCVISIKECEVLSLNARNKRDLARICYIIGNTHSAIFIDENLNIKIPYHRAFEGLLGEFNPKKILAKLHAKERIFLAFEGVRDFLTMQNMAENMIEKPPPTLKISKEFVIKKQTKH